MRRRAFLKHLGDDQAGNVLMILAFALIPMIAATGMVIDYSRAAKAQTKMNAIADATALYAVSPPMLKLTDREIAGKAKEFFNAQASALKGVIYNNDVDIRVDDSNSSTVDRTVNVTYHADSPNFFGNILGRYDIDIGGSAASNTKAAPNIDFYMLLDTSPSMALPATSAGLIAMTKKTKGCAFACHQTETSNVDPPNSYMVNGKYVDYYYIAKSDLKLSLRADIVNSAVSNLTNVAKASALSNHATYRMALGSFDWQYHSIQDQPADLDAARNKLSQIQLLTVCRNDERVCGVNDNDKLTNFSSAWSGVNNILPTVPGNGTSRGGDTPQAVLFLITDGMRDEDYGGRTMGPMPTATCDNIKSRGIKIAVLYTEYLWESASDIWSIWNVRKPFLDAPEKISPPLERCASPGLYYKVTTDGDVSAALANLFHKAVEAAHLVQ